MNNKEVNTSGNMGTRPAEGGKKPFVEPVISSPVDVLEATTFFQAVESGAVLTKKRPGGGGD